MSKLNQKLETIANAAIIVVALVIVGVLVQKYFFAAPPPEQSKRVQPVVGTKINIADFDWAQKPKTLVLALQKGCKYCTESMPFYKRLKESFADKNVKLVAVVPGSKDEGAAYLKESGIENIEVREAPLASIQTSGTPTLILTDDKGEVVRYWVGKLPAEKEQEVIDQLSL